MNDILRRSLIDQYALKLARLALDSRGECKRVREHIREHYGAEMLEAVDAEWPFVMLALFEARCREKRG